MSNMLKFRLVSAVLYRTPAKCGCLRKLTERPKGLSTYVPKPSYHCILKILLPSRRGYFAKQKTYALARDLVPTTSLFLSLTSSSARAMSQKSWESKTRSKKQRPYWERKQESFANVDTGPLIECVVCHVKCFQGRFSRSQLDKYKEALAKERRGGPPAELPRCASCTPKAVAELHCTGCRLTKDLSFFSKQQRKKPDDAKCMNCQQEIEDRLPSLDDALEEERIRDEHRQRTAPGSTQSNASGSVIGSGVQSLAQSIDGDGIYLGHERQSAWGGVSVRSQSPTNTDVSAPRSTSSYSGRGSRSNFAKSGAYNPPIQARVQNQLEREERQRQEAQMASKQDSDDDDDDEWEL
ncbi:hypothetical protein PV04_10165 [Phialophora macrospora]|uniref:Stc1 domain-containing protein n=1 Tax=Phialophora macrospora TaxID=1851006 RepID=A0A0D2FTB9_9EURO|nr:hypothetical protein PV04_10165 [Phialophora macrospora]